MDDTEDLALEANSFIAVLASPLENDESVPDAEAPPKKRTSKKPKRKRAAKAGAAPPRRNKRRRGNDGDSVTTSTDAPSSSPAVVELEAAPAGDKADDFWVAQLLDDVTWEMLEDDSAVVRVAWLDVQPSGRYVYAFDDQVEVQSILCHVLVEEDSIGTFAVTDKSKARIERRLRMAKGSATASDEEQSDEEKPQKERKRKQRVTASGSGRRVTVPGSKKTGGKRAAGKKKTPLDLPPHFATVDASKYPPCEILGTQPHERDPNTTCGNREVVRAVRIKDHELLRNLVTDKEQRQHLNSLSAHQSADVKVTALQYAIQMDDVEAAAVLLKADHSSSLGARPKISLPEHSTGSNDSSRGFGGFGTPSGFGGFGSGRGFGYSGYRQRKVNASRGGKEGNNALLDDDSDWETEFDDEKAFLWDCSTASVQMLTLLHPGNSWSRYGSDADKWVALVAHTGNVKLVRKLLRDLTRDGGWGFSDLFLSVLSPTSKLLPKLRKASVLKQAGSMRIRPLHIAALNPDPQYLKQLWDVAGDDRATLADKDRFQVIHFASVCEGPEPLKFLLKERCAPNVKTKTGLTPIMCALKHGRTENAIAILESTAAASDEALRVVMSASNRDTYQAIHFAAKHGCTEVIKKLVELGADVDSVATGRLSALAIAAQFGQLESVTTLLSLGAKVDLATRQNKTPLMFAVKNGHTDVAATLINHGANLNAFDSSDNTVAHYAASYGWLSCMELLMDAGANFWSCNSWGVPPVIAAMLKQFSTCSKFILKRDVKREFMNFRDSKGCTMLFLQCKHSEDLEQIEYFLENGVDPNIPDVDGKYPIQMLILIARNSLDFSLAAIRLLLQHGAFATFENIISDEDDDSPEQPLNLAIRKEVREIVSLLIEEGGVDPNTRDRGDEDAWHTAAQRSSSLMSLLLDKFGAGHIDFTARTASGLNLFHLLALGQSLSKESLLSVVDACPDVSLLMNDAVRDRVSPLMALLQNQRQRLRSTSDPTFAHEMMRDRIYSDMVAVYAKNTTDRRAFFHVDTIYVSGAVQFSSLSVEAKAAGAKEVEIVGRTALHLACSRALQPDAETPESRWFGDHVLQVVIDALPPGELKQLLDLPTSFSFETPLLLAVKSQDHASVELLLAKGANPNHSPILCNKCYPDSRCEWGPCSCSSSLPLRGTPLMEAMTRNDVVTVDLLLAHGASVNCIGNNESQTPVHMALSTGNADLLKRLIAGGASLADRDNEGRFPLHTAVELRKRDCVEVLLSHGADPALKTGHDDTPLLLAVKGKFTVEKAKARAAEVEYTTEIDSTSALTSLKTSNTVALASAIAGSSSQFGATSSGFGTPAGSATFGGLFGSTPAFGASTGSSAFGTGGFGSPSAFGATASGFGASTGSSAFGTGGFGSPSAFGATASGFGASTGSSAFGTGGFGSPSAFGAPAPAPAPLFGGPAPTFGSAFGSGGGGFGFGSSGNEANLPGTTGQPTLVPAEAETQIMTLLLADASVRRSIGIGDKWQRTPVHYAAQERNLLLLRALLTPLDKTEQSELVNKRDVFGRTPLHFAINSAPTTADATFDVERFLLLCGADVNAADNFSCSSLHFALTKVDMDWQNTYDSEHKDEMEAAAKEDSGLERYEATKRQAFLDYLSNVPGSAATDPVETVSNLAVARGVNVHRQDELGRSPLHLAAATGAVVCMSTLLSAMSSGGDRRGALEMNDLDGFTPLACAFERLRPTTISSLIENGASITDTVRPRKSAGSGTATVQSFFYHALKHQLPGVCQMLLNSNFSRRQAMEDALKLGDLTLASNLMGRIEVSSESHLLAAPSTASGGETLLHFLAKLDKPFDESAQNIAWRLIENGLDATALDAAGNGATHYAAEVGNLQAIDFILHHGGSVNQLTRIGESPMLFALKRIDGGDRTRCYRMLNYFLNKPTTDVTIEDIGGECALSALLSHQCDGIGEDEDFCLWVELLLQRGIDPNRVAIDKILPTPILPEDAAVLLRADSTVPERSVRLPVLSWVSYVAKPSLRMALLALLLKYKASVDSVDEHGDSVVMHLLRRNMWDGVHLVLGQFKAVPNFVTGDVRGTNRIEYAVSVPQDDVVRVLKQTNARGQTALHLAISAFGYASFENASVVELLVSAGADLHTVDGSGHSALDYLADQRSGHIATHLRTSHPELAALLPTAETDADENWESPDYESDSAAYIRECEASGKIKKIRHAVRVNRHCNAGTGSYVLSIPNRVPGEVAKDEASGNELNVYLTKVDTSSGPFGVNVFYRMQAVHDKVQNLFILFTNWGRVGESGSFQNTPFKTVDEVVTEFKKVFRSKTGNDWDSRENFVKQPKKYALVQRVDFQTKISSDVTRSFLQEAFDAQKEAQSGEAQNDPMDDPMDGSEVSPFGSFSGEYPKSLVKLLYGVTDVSNLHSMAPKWSFAASDMPPLPMNDELKTAEKTLKELKVHVGERVKLDDEIQKTSDNMTEESTGLLEMLSNKHAALSETISELCSRYLEVMPYNERSMGQSVREYHTVLDVNKELNRLRQVVEVNQALKILLGAKLRSHVIHPLEYCVRAMQVKMSPLSPESSEAALLSKYFLNGIHPNDRSSYRVVSICGLERRGERQRMEQFRQSAAYRSAGGAGGVPMNRLLWHGTRRANLMSIFTQGLRIAPPDVHSNGQQYGRGIYFADVASKSLGFSDAYSPALFSSPYMQHGSKQRFYLLLCEVALGDSEVVHWGSNNNRKQAKSSHSVLAQGKLAPNPESDVVSSLTGAVVPVGSVGKVGVQVPARDIWGFANITEQDPNSHSQHSPRFELSARGIAWLNLVVRTKKRGETTTKDKKHTYGFFGLNNDITVRVLKCHGGSSSSWEPFDAAVVITTVPNSSYEKPFSFEVRRYRAGYYDPPSDKGLTMAQPRYNYQKLNEFVVFNEAQARIRYIVEVAKDY